MEAADGVRPPSAFDEAAGTAETITPLATNRRTSPNATTHRNPPRRPRTLDAERLEISVGEVRLAAMVRDHFG